MENDPESILSLGSSTAEFVLTSVLYLQLLDNATLSSRQDRLTPSGSYNFLNDKTFWGLIYTSSLLGAGILSKHFKGCAHTNTTPEAMFCTYLVFSKGSLKASYSHTN